MIFTLDKLEKKRDHYSTNLTILSGVGEILIGELEEIGIEGQL